jgi:Fic family protein
MDYSKIISLIAEYNTLNLSQVFDYERFNQYAITHHSTFIEGSTLTLTETRLLLEQQLTPKGKPITHSLMVQDHFNALQFVIASAKNNTLFSIDFIKNINAKVLKQTGAVYQTVFGEMDSSQGIFRKANVSAGIRYFPNYQKVEILSNQLVMVINEKMKADLSMEEKLNLTFDIHFDFVSIHPFYDGNGRTARLLSNYFQTLFGLPLMGIFSEDKVDYFDALEASRNEESLTPFRHFMLSQCEKYCRQEIDFFNKMNSEKPNKPLFSMVF